jgi:hypothetical protein
LVMASTPSRRIHILKKADAIVAVGWRILRQRLKHSRHLDSFIGRGSDSMSCTVSHTVIMAGDSFIGGGSDSMSYTVQYHIQ